MSPVPKPSPLTREQRRALLARLSPLANLRRILGEVPRGSPLGQEALAVLGANALVLLLALLMQGLLGELVWAFFWQSAIGWTLMLRRIRRLERADLAGLTLPAGHAPEQFLRGLRAVMPFILGFTGLAVHLFYALMLLAVGARWPEGSGWLWLAVALLALRAWLAHRGQLEQDRREPPVLLAAAYTPFLALPVIHLLPLLAVLLGDSRLLLAAFVTLRAAFELICLDYERQFAAVLREAERLERR
ncbi:MAG: DUF6498-containing protein [Xanthomonadales bacterium]|nr:DUF6498-containing protein [Xanthomonadales bacterium]